MSFLHFLAAVLLSALLSLTASAADGWRSLADVSTGRIGYVTGTVFDAHLHRHYPEARIVGYNNSTDLIQALKTDKLDAAILARISARAVVDQSAELALLDEAVMRFPLGIGFAKSRSGLRERFNAWLARARADGRYRTIHERWFVHDPEQAVMPVHEPVAPRERYVLAVSVADMPYVAYKDGRHVGFDIEILQTWAAEENIQLEIHTLDFGALLPAIASGKADLISDGIAITDERRKAVDFSDPYAEEQGAAIAWRSRVANSANPVQAVDFDPGQRRVAVLIGTFMDIWASREFPTAQITRFNSQADLMLSLQTGRSDVVLTDAVTARTQAVLTPDLAVAQEGLAPSPIGAAFAPGNKGLRERFDRFLAQLQHDGTLAQMRQRWFVAQPEQVRMPDIALPTVGAPLRVGTSLVLGLPFVSRADGRYIGHETELAQRFARQEGMPVQFVPMEFETLIAALSANKIDAIIANLTITPEREKQVAFSQPYNHETLSVLVRAKDLATPAAPHTALETAAAPASSSWLGELAASLTSTFVTEQRWRLVVEGLWITLTVSLLATLFGTLLGAVVCALRMAPQPWLQQVGRFYIGVIRGLPVLLLLMLTYYVAFARIDIHPVAVAVLAFGMNFAAYVAEIFRSGVRSIDPGQYEAGIAMGFSRLATFIHFILPQAVQRILPVYRGEFISLIKMTSIVGYIGVVDLTKASDIIRSRTFEAFFPLVMVSLAYFLVIWLLGLLLDTVEKRSDPAWRRARRQP
ncbi:ABC transporter permease subunit [Rhodocyclus purpureus]|uniref:ABC transporter permease subunit n=1 Tax=Rhodocyclus purpureus TaxID=1067 RepID=UPI0019143F10|nr:ABC transporter permease subunit [Rhodocyclus purpureus]MBK5914207.1 hypothetical protein [Rhodocyclus purpureus]